MYHLSALGGEVWDQGAGRAISSEGSREGFYLSPASGACLGLWQLDSNLHMPFPLYMSGSEFPHRIKILVILEQSLSYSQYDLI